MCILEEVATILDVRLKQDALRGVDITDDLIDRTRRDILNDLGIADESVYDADLDRIATEYAMNVKLGLKWLSRPHCYVCKTD